MCLNRRAASSPHQWQSLSVQRQLDSQLTRPLVAKHREEIVPERYVYSGVPHLSLLQIAFAIDGFFLRGGIAVGEVYVDSTIVYGKAFLDAVEAEKRANWPRIVFSRRQSSTSTNTLATTALSKARRRIATSSLTRTGSGFSTTWKMFGRTALSHQYSTGSRSTATSWHRSSRNSHRTPRSWPSTSGSHATTTIPVRGSPDARSTYSTCGLSL